MIKTRRAVGAGLEHQGEQIVQIDRTRAVPGDQLVDEGEQLVALSGEDVPVATTRGDDLCRARPAKLAGMSASPSW